MIDFKSNYVMTIGNESIAAESTIDVVNPANEEVIAAVPDASRAQFDRAVASAKSAFPAWRDTPLAERQQMVAALGRAIEEYREGFMSLLTREQGKPRAGAEWEVGGSAIWCTEVAKLSLPTTISEDESGNRTKTTHTPIGVVGGITPWNFPILLAIWKIAPALIAGNTMVLKPSPYTPLCTLKLGELARDILPPGVLNVVSGGDALGAWMTEHPDIGKIAFTGSTPTGKKVVQSSASNLKRVTLELGGNDAAIVLPDVDPKRIAKDLFWACFQNSAQFCVASKRLYVHEDVYDEVCRELVAYAKTIKVGNGSESDTDLGPIQNKMQFDKVCDLIEDTRSIGANILIGGEIDNKPGYYVPVTIIDNPPEDSRCVVEEAFGPVLPVLKYRDMDDVVRRANDTPYGLAGSVWGNNLEQAEKVASQLETGTVWINQAHIFSPYTAFGGHKESGVGIENSLHGVLEYTNMHTIICPIGD